MNYARSILACGVSGLLLTGALGAAVPNAISYQGVVLDIAGQPVSGPVSLRFRIFRGGDDSTLPSTGALVYHERATLATANGVFSHLIGTGTPAADCAGGPCVLDAAAFSSGDVPMWIEVVLDPDGVAGNSDDDVLLPRTHIGSVGYAYRIATIDGATGGTLTGTITADELVGRGAIVVGDASASTASLQFDAAGGSTSVTWNAGSSALEFGARTRHTRGLSIDAGQSLRFGASEALTTDGTGSALQIGTGFPLVTFPTPTRFESSVEFLQPTTFDADVTFAVHKGFVQDAAITFPGGQVDGTPGAPVRMRSFMYEPIDAASDAPGSVPGNDTEFIWAGPYYNAQPLNLQNRENPADYSLGFQFTAGWTHMSGDRRAEYIWRHITKDGSTIWTPFYWNIVGVDTNTPLVDYTIYTSPGQIALQVNRTAVAIHGAAVGRGDLEVSSGAGTAYLAGSTGGKVKFEGTTSDTNQTELTARNPTADRAIELPDASGMVHLDPFNAHIGTVMFGDSDDSADTGNEVCQSVNLVCVDVRRINGTDSDCTTDQGTAPTLFYAFCRR
jgi:hypothetical protein